MSRLIITLAFATLSLGVGNAIAKDADATATKQWKDFQAAVKKCDTQTGTNKENCLSAAKQTYRSANFDCDAMASRDKAQCQKYRDEWETAARSTDSTGTTPPVRTGEPNAIPTDPGDPTDKERNRDSTKQQEGSTQPSKQQ